MMKKHNRFRLPALVICTIIVFSAFCVLPCGAAGYRLRLIDNADILSPTQEDELGAKLDDLSETYGVDVFILTTDTLNGSYIRDYADDYLDNHGYARGSGRSAILLVRYINGYDKDVWISTVGKGISILTDDDIDWVFDQMEYNCRTGNDYGAFLDFIYAVQAIQAGQSEPNDYNHIDVLRPVLIAVIVGVVVALIVTGIMKGKLKTVRPQQFAGNYIRDNSLEIRVARDIYLYKTVSRTRRSQSSGSSGSSTHRSSSGTTHGGGGRHM